MFKPSNRRQSVSEKDKLCKKPNKKKKTGKKSRTLGVEEAENPQVEVEQVTDTVTVPDSTANLSADSPDNNGTRFPSLSVPETQCGPKSSTGPSCAVSPASVFVNESQSVNTDLSESTISLLSSTGNSRTDLLGQPGVPGPYSTSVDTLMQSLSVHSVKNKSPGVPGESPRVSRQAKSQQRSSSRKTSGLGKSKNCNATSIVQNGKSGNQKPRPCDDKTDRANPATNTDNLRWEMALSDSDDERERLKIYKHNRRKRYHEAAQAKGLAWAYEYTEIGTPSASKRDINEEIREVTQQQSTPNFSTVRSLVPVTVHTVRGKIVVEC